MVYSVLTEPVIPVLLPDGTNASVGIREAFLKAHEIRDIQGDTPLERYALLRLLIASTALSMPLLWAFPAPSTTHSSGSSALSSFFSTITADSGVVLVQSNSPAQRSHTHKSSVLISPSIRRTPASLNTRPTACGAVLYRTIEGKSSPSVSRSHEKGTLLPGISMISRRFSFIKAPRLAACLPSRIQYVGTSALIL